ncbi:MAG: class D sortase [Firmicutes bacterium]|nr:class D sortase [Bacillota bacterium]
MRRRPWQWALAGALVLTGGLLATLPLWLPPAAAAYGTWAAAGRPVRPARHPGTPPAAAAAGSRVGILRIPALGLTVPVLQGDDEAVLWQGAGHVPASAWPGEPGTSVLAAHNATFFRHLNRLRPGQAVEVDTGWGRFIFRVTGRRVVPAGSPLFTGARPRLVLEACYPLNALYLTPDRYLVLARLVQAAAPGAAPAPPRPPAFHAAIPPALTGYPLGLAHNALPMGILTYPAAPAGAVTAFTRNGASLVLARQAVHLWEAVQYAARYRRVHAWQALIVPPAALPPFWGAAGIRDLGPLNLAVTLSAEGRPRGLVMEDSMVEAAGRIWAVRMTARVTAGGTVTLTGIRVQPDPAG